MLIVVTIARIEFPPELTEDVLTVNKDAVSSDVVTDDGAIVTKASIESLIFTVHALCQTSTENLVYLRKERRSISKVKKC